MQAGLRLCWLHMCKLLVFVCISLTLVHSERPKIVYNFGLSECNRVIFVMYTNKLTQYTYLHKMFLI